MKVSTTTTTTTTTTGPAMMKNIIIVLFRKQPCVVAPSEICSQLPHTFESLWYKFWYQARVWQCALDGVWRQGIL